MANATGLINKVNAALRRTNPVDRTVYKRVITRSGGDPLLGIAGATVYTDVQIEPPPIYSRIGRNIVGGAVSSEALDTGSSIVIGDDYQIMFSVSAVTKQELSNPDLQIVLKDSDNLEEVYRITDYETVPYAGQDVVLLAYMRSTSRPSS